MLFLVPTISRIMYPFKCISSFYYTCKHCIDLHVELYISHTNCTCFLNLISWEDTSIVSLVAGLTVCLSLHSHSQNGATALFVASQNGHTSTVDVLLRNGADPNIAKKVSASVVNFGNVKQRQVCLCKGSMLLTVIHACIAMAYYFNTYYKVSIPQNHSGSN